MVIGQQKVGSCLVGLTLDAHSLICTVSFANYQNWVMGHGLRTTGLTDRELQYGFIAWEESFYSLSLPLLLQTAVNFDSREYLRLKSPEETDSSFYYAGTKQSEGALGR